MNAQTIDYAQLQRQVDAHPYPLVFATISGAHLYGFPSADSDFDLRGVQLLPLKQVVGLDPGEETVEKEGMHDGIEMDLVTHDAKKFFSLMLKKNGYVLEQLLSPLVVHTTPEHGELKAIAGDCITRHHAHHYLGFAATQWKLFRKEDPPKVKPLLYVYRVLLTGIHLMCTGEVEANLLALNETAKLPYIDELVERKLAGPEKGQLDEADAAFHQREYERLVAELEVAMEKSALPEQASGKATEESGGHHRPRCRHRAGGGLCSPALWRLTWHRKAALMCGDFWGSCETQAMTTTTQQRRPPLGLFSDKPATRLSGRMVEVLRVRHFRRCTDDTYFHWIPRYIEFHDRCHPRNLDESDWLTGPMSARRKHPITHNKP